MSLRKDFGSDKSKEQSGIWLEITENDDGTICRMKIARASSTNKKFTKAMASKSKGSRHRAYVSQEKQQKDYLEVFCSTILLDWENVIDIRTEEAATKNERLPFTQDNAVWLLNELPDLFDYLTTESTTRSNFQEVKNEDAAKNLSPFSSTS